MLGENATPEALAAVREKLGLGDPVLLQYWHWLSHLLEGDFGTSMRTGQQVGPAMFLALSRSLVLAVPGEPTLAPSDVSVSENGRPVAGQLVTPISSAGARDFGIVLAIDVSPSMSGATLANAMRAGRELAARRNGAQQLGVIEFDELPRVVLPLTANDAAITRTLAHTPRVGPGTHIYDALSLALGQLRHALHIFHGYLRSHVLFFPSPVWDAAIPAISEARV